jgi:predicted AAA+ superfamily ATPase
MEELLTQSRQLVQSTPVDFTRFLMAKIEWNTRLTGVIGARGTGKTTLLLQRIKQTHGSAGKAVYLSLDDIYFTEHRLVDTARQFSQKGFTHLFLDEVHKYPGWAREIKNLYDFDKSLTIVFTGSSIIDVLHEEVDLSRRAVIYELPGLSFREYLTFRTGTAFEEQALESILADHEAIALAISDKIKPLQHFEDYLKAGYYPFFAESPGVYHRQLNRIIQLVIETDLHFIEGVNKENIRKIYQLLYILAANVPFKPNISKLSERVGLHRNTLVQYLHSLEKARLINLLHASGASISTLKKPEKVYAENTNLIYAIAAGQANKGAMRESFFLNQVKNAHKIELPQKGDFIIDHRYIVEIGGRNKTAGQIQDMDNAYVAADDIEIGTFTKIPLWLFGFLY